MSIRVAIIDDDPALLAGLRTVIDSVEGLLCAGAFSSVEDAMPVLRRSPPDVLLLDIDLPGIHGDEAIALFRDACASMRIVMLTIFTERERLFSSICNGAHGYLLKTTPPAKLLEAIRAVHDGGSPLSPEMARYVVEVFQKAKAPTQDAGLSSQEQRLLTLLAEGYSYQAAAGQMNLSVNTVRNYIRSIYEKLHVHSKSEAVSKGLRQGIIG